MAQISTVDELTTNKEYIVLFVSSVNCKPCKIFEPIFNKWATMYEKYADFMKCDVSSEISEKFEVMKIPTFLVLKKDIVVKQFIGSDGETRIQQGLNDTFVKIVIDNDF